MIATQTNPDIAPPPGAALVGDWEPGPPAHRVILGPRRVVGEAVLHTVVDV
jgi:hypothetical protein